LFLGNKDAGEIRKGLPQFESYLTHHQISNVLHVLFNERPVPFFGACVYQKQDRLIEKAKNSFLKIEVPTWVTKKGDVREIKEICRTRKAFWNSNAKITNLTWDLIEAYLKEHYGDFITMLIEATGHSNIRKVPVEDVPDIFKQSLNSASKQALLSHFRERKVGKTGVVNWLRNKTPTDKNDPMEMAKDSIAKGLMLVVPNGIDKTIRLSGTLIVPLDEEDKEVLENSAGVATILDGGLVWIERVVSGNRLSIEGYDRVGDISTKLTIES